MSDAVTLPLRAENNPKFYSRFLWLGLAALGFMAYCLYDGFVNYPDQKVRGEALLTVAEETIPVDKREELMHGGHGMGGYYTHLVESLPDYPEFQSAWESRATAEGWSMTPPAKLRTDGAILNQHIMAVIAALGAAHFLFTVYRTRGRWFELGESGITSRWGESFSLDQVTEIDKKQWRDKGIARLRYKDSKGRQRTFVVDDYKYHRKTTDRILWHIENVVGFDKIVSGKPGPDPDAKPEPPPVQADAPADTSEA